MSVSRVPGLAGGDREVLEKKAGLLVSMWGTVVETVTGLLMGVRST